MHAVVPYSSQQAGGAQSRTIPYRSRRFGIGSPLGYAAFEWLESTWCLRGWSQHPPWNHADASHSTSFETASKYLHSRHSACQIKAAIALLHAAALTALVRGSHTCSVSMERKAGPERYYRWSASGGARATTKRTAIR